ncbi:Transposon, En/Spm-like protein [Quillaja saponaria]|uniref:Transposon, En/Spm-like protein n=1 Tax=Quillaja saponaria TaxID=32244 RepID=A0AAD7KW60_QUISA|nr:Transposon, En/Spm-like protein [Quillaja saponaria]
MRQVRCFNGYFVNGFKFHTLSYGDDKKSMNSGVRVKGSCYGVDERDFYGMLTDIIEMQYFGNNRIVLFQCDWYDSYRGMKIDSLHGLVDINHKSRLASYEPFILAAQAHQVYYANYPSKKRNDWWAVCNMAARNNFNFQSSDTPSDDVQPLDDDIFQEVELNVPVPVTVGLDLDAPGVLVRDDPSEEVDPNEINEARFVVDDDIIEEEYDDILENEDDDEEDNDELEMDGEEIMVRSIHGSGSNASRDPPSMNQTSRTTRKSSQSSRAIPSSSQAGFALPRSSSQAGSALPRSSAQVGSTLPRSSQSTHADIPSSPGDRDVGHIMESSGHNSPLGTSGDLSTSRAPVIEPLVTRGYAHLDPPPTNPADRPLIRIRTDSEFDNHDTVRTIKSIIEAHMPGPIPVWSQYPRIARDLCYRQFLAHYRFNTEQEEKDGKIVFEKIAGRRYRDVLRDARAKAKIMCKTEDISKCEGWMPDWMTVENWRGLLQIWSSEQWKKRSKIGTQNRGLGEESIVRHAGGSISVLQHKEKLEEYIREVSEKYGEDSDAHPSFDPDIWLKVTGGVQKGGKVYGCGTPGAARALFGDKINSSRSSLRSTVTSQPDVASAERIHTLEQQLEYQKRKTDEMSNIMKVMMDKLGLDPSILGGLQKYFSFDDEYKLDPSYWKFFSLLESEMICYTFQFYNMRNILKGSKPRQ